jgi:hypothetical protein
MGWDAGLRQNVIAALMAGTQPDVIVGEFQLSEYASLGALLPLDDATVGLLSFYDNLICFIFLFDFFINLRAAPKKSDYFLRALQ